MNKILVSEGINYLLELPKEPDTCFPQDCKDGEKHLHWIEKEARYVCTCRQAEINYELAKTSAIDEAKKNGQFEEQDRVFWLLRGELKECYSSNVSEIIQMAKEQLNGEYDLPEGLETERVWQVKACFDDEVKWVDNGHPVLSGADYIYTEYRQIVRITKQKQ